MENIEIIRQRYQEARNAYNTGKDSAYYGGKMVGIVEAVASIKGISWVEAAILMNKSEGN